MGFSPLVSESHARREKIPSHMENHTNAYDVWSLSSRINACVQRWHKTPLTPLLKHHKCDLRNMHAKAKRCMTLKPGLKCMQKPPPA